MKVRNYTTQQNSASKPENSRNASEGMAFRTNPVQPVNKEAGSFFPDTDDQAYRYVTAPTGRIKDKNVESTRYQKTEAKLRLIETLVYQMTGKRVKLQVKPLQSDAVHNASQPPASGLGPLQERDKWGLKYEYQETFAESDSISFNSGGVVITSDEKTIMFSLEFSMSRSYYEQNHVNIRMGNAVMVDPLMMGISGSHALNQGRTGLDLDGGAVNVRDILAMGDGGFLPLERRGGDEASQGGEPCLSKGDGFTQLCVYDIDRHAWINGADDVFSRLSMTTLLEESEKTLVKLANVGVGAIYLEEMEAPFAFKDTADVFGEVGDSSVFLREDGSVNTIHHIDL